MSEAGMKVESSPGAGEKSPPQAKVPPDDRAIPDDRDHFRGHELPLPGLASALGRVEDDPAITYWRQEALLHRAVEDNDLILAKQLLDDQIHADSKNYLDEGRPVLHQAVNLGHEEMVKLLLDSGADVNIEHHDDERTALHIAAGKGNDKLVQLLLDRGANVNAADSVGLTVLHAAVLGRTPSTVRMLLRYGANVDARNNLGETALHHAAEVWQEELVTLLLEFGADPSIKNEDGETADDVTKRLGPKPVFQSLWHTPTYTIPPDKGDQSGSPPVDPGPTGPSQVDNPPISPNPKPPDQGDQPSSPAVKPTKSTSTSPSVSWKTRLKQEMKRLLEKEAKASLRP